MSEHVDHALLIHAVEGAADGILIVDGDGTIEYANTTITRFSGYAIDQLVGSNVDRLVPSDTRAGHVHRRRQFADEPSQRPMGSGLELVMERADGTMLPVEISLSPLRHNGDRYVIAAIRDVSERTENQRRLVIANEQLALFSERERIGRDLHDVVLQHLYGMGLSVQAVGASGDDDRLRGQLEPIIEEIDHIISEVRTIVFALGTSGASGNLGQELTDVVAQANRVLAFTPSLRLEGPVESVLIDEIRAEMMASMREALGNVARHAGASQATVVVSVDGDRVVMRVTDNGIGPPDDTTTSGGYGLSNLRSRAAAFGGDCVLTAGDDGGAMLTWWAPFA